MTELKLLSFTADWCEPCKNQKLITNEFAQDYSEVTVEEINVDNNSDFANRYQVRSVPTLVLVEDSDSGETTVVNCLGAWSQGTLPPTACR